MKENSFVEEETPFKVFPIVKPNRRRFMVLVKETICIPPRTEVVVCCNQYGMEDPSILYTDQLFEEKYQCVIPNVLLPPQIRTVRSPVCNLGFETVNPF